MHAHSIFTYYFLPPRAPYSHTASHAHSQPSPTIYDLLPYLHVYHTLYLTFSHLLPPPSFTNHLYKWLQHVPHHHHVHPPPLHHTHPPLHTNLPPHHKTHRQDTPTRHPVPTNHLPSKVQGQGEARKEEEEGRRGRRSEGAGRKREGEWWRRRTAERMLEELRMLLATPELLGAREGEGAKEEEEEEEGGEGGPMEVLMEGMEGLE